MNFKPELAQAVMAGRKTVTRRIASENPRSPWYINTSSLRIGRDYAVCPGRGKNAIGRVRVTAMDLQRLGYLTDAEAKCEGFTNWEQFTIAWQGINGDYDPHALVWRVEFEVVAREAA